MNLGKRHINGGDNDLFSEISRFMKAKSDIEEVINDPDLSYTRDSVKEMISEYKKGVAEKGISKKNQNYIKESLSGRENREARKDYTDNTDSDIDLLTADWVKEWHKHKRGALVTDPEAEERKIFIIEALNSRSGEVNEDVPYNIREIGEKKTNRSLFIRYISLSAAAVVGALILINTLLPSSAEKLFRSYYNTFEAISPITRSTSGTIDDIYISAIVSYRSGDYKKANAGFAAAKLKNPESEAPLFYMGLTNIELGNISQAIQELADVADGSGEYVKDAQWYLGMAYLRSGDKLKAKEYIGKLAKSQGYYRERSEKLLSRLK